MENSNHWNPFHDYDFSLPKKNRETCPAAQEFEGLVQQEFQGLDQASLLKVNQLKLITTDLYFLALKQVPKQHQDRISSRGHRCIYHVFREYYQKLLDRERHITPPRLFEPPPPPPPPAPPQLRLAGMTWGEVIEQEE